MSASKIQIWNMALGFIGTRTVASENERTPEAIQCALYWDNARRACLRDYPYNFAQARTQLASIAVPETYADEWRYAYRLPDLCLKAHKVVGATCGCANAADRRIPFIIVSDTEKMELLLSDAEKVRLDYTRDVPEVALWDDLFMGMMARKLASLICVPLLKNNTTKVQELEQLYRASLPKAMEANASERREKPYRDTWIAARGGWYDA